MRVGECNITVPFSELTIEVVGRCVEYEGGERERALAWASFSESQEMKEEKVMI